MPRRSSVRTADLALLKFGPAERSAGLIFCLLPAVEAAAFDSAHGGAFFAAKKPLLQPLILVR
jgi:hypothetical protein